MDENPLQLDEWLQHSPLPGQAYLQADQLKPYLDAAQIIQQAYARAEAIQQDAEETLEQAQQEAQALLIRAEMQAEQMLEARVQQACEEAIAAAVQWMVEDQALEQHIAHTLTIRWRTVTAQVLQTLLAQHDQTPALLCQVERKVAKLLSQGQVKLYVNPEAQTAACAKFSDRPQIAVEIDSSLEEGQARLDNGLVRIHFDLPAWQQRILQQLSAD